MVPVLGSKKRGIVKSLFAKPAYTANPDAPENERLPVGTTFAFGLQHVLTMYGGILAVPLIIGNAAGLSADEIAKLVTGTLFVGGLATILQSASLPFLGSRLPLVQGVSFAAVATMLAILNGGSGLQDVFGAIIAASIIGFLIAPFFAKIIRFFPPVVTGTVITAIGLTLFPVAANWAMGGDDGADDYGSMMNISLALLTFVIIIVFSKVGVAILSRLAILLGLVAGTIVAWGLGQADFSDVGDGLPIAFPGLLEFGVPTFDIAAIVSMVIVILVIKTETTADIIAVGEIIRTPVDSRRIADGLRADMLSSAIAPFFGSFTQSAFAQNVGLVALSGIKSRWVVTAGGAIMVILGLVPWLGQVVAAIPMPILGGAGIVLFGTVAASGIRSLSTVKYDGNMNLVIVASALAFGMIPVVSPDFYAAFPAWVETIFHSGISSAAIVAVILNIVFNEIAVKTTTQASVFAAKPLRYLTLSHLEDLQDGDVFVDGKLVDCDGEEIPVVPEEKLPVVQEKIQRGEVTTTAQIAQVVAEDKTALAPDAPAEEVQQAPSAAKGQRE